MTADDVQAPLAVFVHGTDLLDVLDENVRVGFVSTQNEVGPVCFRVAPLREADVAVFGVVLEAVFFERDRRARVVVVVFAVAGRVRSLVPVVVVAIPAVERLIEFFKNSLTGLCIEVRVAFVCFEVGFERTVIGNLAASVPDAARCLAGHVPEFCGGETKLIETVSGLPLVPNGSAVSPSDGLNRHV